MVINTAYYKQALTGGATNALDGINGTSLKNIDPAFVTVSGVLYVYQLDASSGAAESSPDVIAPDNNAGDKRWWLQDTVIGATGSDAPVRATSPTLVTPALGTPASGDLKNCDLSVPPAIGETTPDSIRGLNKEVYKVNTAASPLTAAECAGTIVSNYGMTDAGCVITLPAAAEGLAFVCILPAVRAQYFRLNAGAGDKIYLSGVAGTDAEYIGVASGYATGTSISMFCFKASDGSFDWFAIPLFGTWSAE